MHRFCLANLTDAMFRSDNLYHERGAEVRERINTTVHEAAFRGCICVLRRPFSVLAPKIRPDILQEMLRKQREK